MRRQRDEALKHCGDMLRALQQVSQTVREGGNVGPDRAGHGVSLTENMWHPYSKESLMDNGSDVMRLAQRAYPEFNYTALDQVARDQFVHGLPDADMKRHVLGKFK